VRKPRNLLRGGSETQTALAPENQKAYWYPSFLCMGVQYLWLIPDTRPALDYP
jgi:hypothetical protein